MSMQVEEDNAFMQVHSEEEDDQFNVPSNFDDVNEDDNEEAEQEQGPVVKKPKIGGGRISTADFEMDIGTLLATRVHPVDSDLLVNEAQKRKDYLEQLATEGTQALVEQLFKLPTESCDVGILAVLPAPTIELPREKPVPKPKPPTRWEKFAARKGIQKKEKRDRLVWDEASEDWKPRYGANKANNKENQWLFEHKAGDDDTEDPWTKMKQEKKARVEKNKRQQVQNLIAATGQKLPGAIDLASAVKAAKPAAKQSKKESGDNSGLAKAEHAKVALHLAQQSTASMGKFDRLHKDEAKPKQSRIVKKASLVKKTPAKKKEDSNKPNLDTEKNASLQLLSRVLEPPKLNVQKAVLKQKQEEEHIAQKVNQLARKGGKRKRS